MAFTNIGSAEGNFSGVSSGSDTVSPAVPSLGANRVGTVTMSFIGPVDTSQDVTGITWDGVAMTPGVTIDAGAYSQDIYYITGMAHNGTYDIVVSYSASAAHNAMIVVAWADANDTISIDDTSTGSGTSQNPAITSTQAGANELVVSASSSAANGVDATPLTNATLLQEYDQGGNCAIVGYSIPTGSGDTTHTHNYTQSGNYAIASISFQEASAPGGSSIKTVDGIAIASVKTIDTIAIANVKTRDTISNV